MKLERTSLPVPVYIPARPKFWIDLSKEHNDVEINWAALNEYAILTGIPSSMHPLKISDNVTKVSPDCLAQSFEDGYYIRMDERDEPEILVLLCDKFRTPTARDLNHALADGLFGLARYRHQHADTPIKWIRSCFGMCYAGASFSNNEFWIRSR